MKLMSFPKFTVGYFTDLVMVFGFLLFLGLAAAGCGRAAPLIIQKATEEVVKKDAEQAAQKAGISSNAQSLERIASLAVANGQFAELIFYANSGALNAPVASVAMATIGCNPSLPVENAKGLQLFLQRAEAQGIEVPAEFGKLFVENPAKYNRFLIDAKFGELSADDIARATGIEPTPFSPTSSAESAADGENGSE